MALVSDAVQRERENGMEILAPPPRPPYWEKEIDTITEVGSDGRASVTLWRALRATRLWIDTPAEKRASLLAPLSDELADRFAHAVRELPELTEAFGVFALLHRSPELLSTTRIAQACTDVYAWAERNSLLRTAMFFAEVAATAADPDPLLSNVAGRACRRAGEFTRSRVWYEHGFRIAKRGQKRVLIATAVRSLLGIGRLLQDAGDLDGAKRYFEQAVSRAGRRNRRPLAAEAHHDLFALLAETGDFTRAEEHAEGALLYYGLRHPRFPYAVHDFAYLLVRRSYFRLALVLLDRLPPYFARPGEKALVYSTQAWAAAAVALESEFRAAEERTLRLVGLSEEHASSSLLHLSEGARYLHDWDCAVAYAGSAREAAAKRGMRAIEREADEMRSCMVRRELPPPPVEPEDGTTAFLVRRYAERLRRWKGPDASSPSPPPV